MGASHTEVSPKSVNGWQLHCLPCVPGRPGSMAQSTRRPVEQGNRLGCEQIELGVQGSLLHLQKYIMCTSGGHVRNM